MSDFDFNSKGLARSKHYHSKHKDKNLWKKKAKHVVAAKQQKEQEGKTNEKAPNTANATEEKKPAENGEENEEEVQAPTRSKFSRRVLESNDYRYKDIEETEDEKVDVKALISNTNDSNLKSEAFRLQGEREWDDDELLSSSSSGVDFEALGRSLQSLPLTAKLGAPVEVLTADLVFDIPNRPAVSSNTLFPLITATTTREKPEQAIAVPVVDTRKDKTNREDEDLLDNLLSLDVKKEEKVEEKKVAVPAAAKNEDDLESWLETVL